MQQPKIEFRQVRDFGEVINDTFVFIKQNFKPMMKSVITISGIFAIGFSVVSILAFLNLKELIKGGGLSNPTERVENTLSATIPVYIFTFLVFFMVSLATLCYIAVYVEKNKETPTITEVWSYTKYYFLRYLGSNILAFLMLILGFVCCVLPGFYLWPISSLITTAIILENGGISYSFSRGFKLVKENWWSSFGTLIILSIIYYACTMAVSIPFLLAGSGASFLTPDFSQPVILIIIQNVIGAFALYFVMIPIIGVALLFFSLVEQKESEGLMQRIQSVDDDAPKNSPEEEF